MLGTAGTRAEPIVPPACADCQWGPSLRSRVRGLGLRILEAHEKERASFARELHDELGQSLTLLLVRLELLDADEREPALRQELERLRDDVSGIVLDVQRLAVALGPAELDHSGLAAALRSLVARVGTRIPVELAIDTSAHPPRAIGLTLYRVAQEALTNALRHAAASRISIRLTAAAGALRLEVEDDGRGFDPNSWDRPSNIGLLGMAKRVELVEGSFALVSTPGRGTCITAEVPMP